MKRILSFIIAACILFSAAAAYADNAPKDKLKQRLKAGSTSIADIKAITAQIRENKTKLVSLKALSKAAYEKAKKNINKLIKEKDSLTQAQLITLKDAAAIIKSTDMALIKSNTKSKENILGLKQARDAKDTEKTKEYLNKILAEQNEQIKQLKQFIKDLNRIAKI